MKIHINKSTIISQSYRILPKYCSKFTDKEFKEFLPCLNYGLMVYKKGFRVFKQRTYEWYEPLNILLAKINDIRKEVGEDETTSVEE